MAKFSSWRLNFYLFFLLCENLQSFLQRYFAAALWTNVSLMVEMDENCQIFIYFSLQKWNAPTSSNLLVCVRKKFDQFWKKILRLSSGRYIFCTIFMRIPKMVPEFLLSACIFLTSREVRLGSLVTFDPHFDPLKMRKRKKEEYFLLLLFWEESKSAIRFWFWQLWNFDPCGGSYLEVEPLTFDPWNLHFPNFFWQNKHIVLKLMDSSWEWYNGEEPTVKKPFIVSGLIRDDVNKRCLSNSL